MGRNASALIATAALFLSITTFVMSYLNTIRSERAYVSASAANAFNFSPGGGLQTYLLVSNSGKTLAQVSKIEIGVAILTTLPTNFDDLGKVEPELGKFTMWPSQPYVTFRTFGKLSEADYQSVYASKKRIVVFGKIDYTDIFGVARRTVFCHMYFGSETANFPANGGRGYDRFQARYCDRHNDAT